MEPGSSGNIGIWLFVIVLVALSAFLSLARTALANVVRQLPLARRILCYR